MPELCYVFNCPNPGDDEYTYLDFVPALGREFPVTWKLCGDHCEFAIDVVESVANLEKVVETWKS